ncbi:SKI complex subunit WD repeat protein SKI8 SCDLUD_002309 [Saccharomycodes ludwigii]|uniref:SKI complex subunit WD repeat protein SKI8 n=1 Tax=Saccharomycodes ludwigii TaxID=36035 RepID=UPI001E8B21FA|nr:hypothetical protein SCDLUD_002309 [Saccharomycodes ludwigii]KAH3900854.1 hypothetical protein SCDLUD_002309 [Saccharomycodes ludwigii]
MSKLYIPTTNAGLAHDADIFDLQVTIPYTITCSGDGYIKLWKNKLLEGQLPQDFCYKQFVSKMGVHHLSYLHTIEPNTTLETFIISCVSFDGKLHLYQFDLKTLVFKNLGKDCAPIFGQLSFWSVNLVEQNGIYDASNANNNISHKLLATTVNGEIYSWDLKIKSPEQNGTETALTALDQVITIQNHIDVSDAVTTEIEENSDTKGTISTGTIFNNSMSGNFPLCLSHNISNEMVAVGYNNGILLLLELNTLKPVFQLQISSYPIRSLSFAPQPVLLEGHNNTDISGNYGRKDKSKNDTLLAVSHDMGSYGRLSLVSTKYGEHICDLSIPSHSSTALGTNNNSSGSANIVAFAHESWCLSCCFNETGKYLVSGGLDGKLRVWDVDKRERVSTLHCSNLDIEDDNKIMKVEKETGKNLSGSVALGVLSVKFINKDVRNNTSNEGLCCVCIDRGIRWYREAGSGTI